MDECFDEFARRQGFGKTRKGFYVLDIDQDFRHVITFDIMKHYHEFWITPSFWIQHFGIGRLVGKAWGHNHLGLQPDQKQYDANIAGDPIKVILARRAGIGCMTHYPLEHPDQLNETLANITSDMQSVFDYFEPFSTVETTIAELEKNQLAGYAGHDSYLMALYHLTGKTDRLETMAAALDESHAAPITERMKTYLLD